MKRKGSFTIEAAFLMPVLILVIFLILQISFFLYNREAVTVMASQAVLQGVQMEKEGKHTIQKSLQAFLSEETKERLLFTETVRWDVSVTATKVKVTIFLSQNTLFRRLSCEATEEMSRLTPASLLWEKERWQR